MGIEVSGLGRRFGSFWAVRDVSFSVRAGSITGLLGPNGAGKSTTMRMLSGYLPLTEGAAWVNGVSVGSRDKSWRRGLGYLAEQNPLYVDMYVGEYLSHVCRLYGLRGVQGSVRRVVELTGLGPMQHRRIRHLSKGYRQRVGLAAALIARPETLILDEPTNGLDPNQIVEIRRVIREIGRDAAVLLSTHIMQEVEAMCEQVAIISRGGLVACGSTSELLRMGAGGRLVFRLLEEVGHEALAKALGIGGLEKLDAHEWSVPDTGDDGLRRQVFETCLSHGWTLVGLSARGSHLEDVFRSLTLPVGADPAAAAQGDS